MNTSKPSLLQTLAEMNGVQPSFLDAANQRRSASPEVLSAVLKALGLPTGNQKEIRDSLHATRLRPYQRGLDPVVIAWEEREAKVRCHLPAALAGNRMQLRIHFEDGKLVKINPPCRTLGADKVEGEGFATKEFVLPPLPLGYHHLEISVGGKMFRTLVLSAPIQSYAEPGAGKRWGVFLPMYAAHSRESWGAGNFSDWERFSDWLGSQGGRVAGTLPLLAAFLDHPVCEPSPYSPVSRRFWNEFFLDLERVPEFAVCREAQALVRAKAFQKNLRAFRRSEIIDYSAQWSARRQVLELLARCFFSKARPRSTQFNQYLRERPEAHDYAAFRATCDKLKTSWHNWPQRLREGRLCAGDYDEPAKKFHLYVQWLAHEQMNELARHSEQSGVKLYLDLPLGVHPDGYDVWRERESFALDASVGAPPDLFFSKGQDWGFAPLHPQRIRESAYQYVLAFLRFQMRHAGMLRLDHVMGLHRLYWVPRGVEAGQGTYVHYPADELHAIFNLESHRSRTVLVGENLGTVPPAVNESMARHRLREMYVTQFEERPDSASALRPPPALSVASLDTHDTPTFAAHWRGADLAERVRLGILPSGEMKNAKKHREKLKAALIKFLRAEGFLKNRQPSARDVLRALLAWLWASPSEIVLVTVEDLWLETLPQNVPGTSSERPNWRRKARFSLEQIFTDKRLRKLLPF
ncbi:MAG TPA: 4-alpha-glucanotransferase [Verrucomicrobiae bacterium]|jgi:4-alpha-glucanotransferase|nr:4-alpha-glucanotransferase [Verrucomicrobiae bacterium]